MLTARGLRGEDQMELGTGPTPRRKRVAWGREGREEGLIGSHTGGAAVLWPASAGAHPPPASIPQNAVSVHTHVSVCLSSSSPSSSEAELLPQAASECSLSSASALQLC